MRVLLVQADLCGSRAPIFPIGLSYVATALKKHEVRIFDPNITANYLVELEKTVRDFQPNVIGLSLRNIRLYLENSNTFIPYDEQLEPIIQVVKRADPDGKIVIGGPAFSMFAEQIMSKEPEIDFGVFLDGEESMPELLENLSSPEQVTGLYVRNGDGILFTGNRNLPDLSTLGAPRRDLVSITKYFGAPDAIGVQTKRGCPLSCAYCVYPFLSGYRFCLRPVGAVVDEIEDLQNRYHVKSIMFADSVFNVPQGHAAEICAEMLRRRVSVRWTAYFNEKSVSEDFMLLCRDAGCYEFFFSPDSYSNKTLRMFKKNIEKEDIIRSYKIARRHKGIRVRYNFMLNVPGESLLTLAQMAVFIVRAKIFLRGKLSGIGIGRPRIEPHTDLYDTALREGIIQKDTDLIQPVLYSYPSASYLNPVLKFLLLIKRICQGTVCLGKSLFLRTRRSVEEHV
jgi:radical SAM superfamily enzyme YgiQ (UPF0313 family)